MIDYPYDKPADLLEQPSDAAVVGLRQSVAKLTPYSITNLMTRSASALEKLHEAVLARDFEAASAASGVLASLALAIMAQGLYNAALVQEEKRTGKAHTGAPYLDPEQAVAYDMNELEGQPEVKEGDTLTLSNGQRAVLVSVPREEWPEGFGWGTGGEDPELLFFRHGGKLYLGAINGRSIVGLEPVLHTAAANLKEFLGWGGKSGKDAPS